LHYWRVKALAADSAQSSPWSSVASFGTGVRTSIEGGNGLPSSYGLEQNYPNPFNPSTVIQYALPQPGAVRLNVYDMMGRKVATLVDGPKAAGYHQVVFDARHLGSGAYMYRLEAGNAVLARTLYLIK
jgi:hypothetical protein